MAGINDPQAEFTALFEAQYTPVLRYALREVPRHTAHDVAAETFLTAWRRLPEVPDPPLPWLLGVARRVVANQRRGETRRHALRLAVEQHRPPAGGNPAETLVERDTVRAALGRLSTADRELLTLIGWDGLSVREAAQVLGIRPGAASVRLHRARRRLQEQLPTPTTPSSEHTPASTRPAAPAHPRPVTEEAS
ncbi:RNA polymerase sigma factor [Frankia sp. R43]|uniref:RNA polymerase sigma factor n=1 Tax=Frankia sp. R43 TaxID=269536 RepID=UPI0006CA25DD|nr:RNA polymerase sigma factor [Frankia sp. R43]